MTKRAILVALPAAAVIGAAGLLAGFAPAERPAVGSSTGQAATYTVDTVHSGIIFQIRHSGISNFYGRFNDFDGTFTFDPADHSVGSFEFEVRTESVDTGNQKRDDHLRNADFFNSRQFPTITFQSTSVEHVEGDAYRLTGDMTLHGETRPVTADLVWLGTTTGMNNRELGAFEARFEIKRSDFGMSKYLAPDGGEGGGLGNTVKLIVAVEAVKD